MFFEQNSRQYGNTALMMIITARVPIPTKCVVLVRVVGSW